jgi:surfactin synthase thioesterase subunit
MFVGMFRPPADTGFGHQRGLCLAFDVERALRLEEDLPAALRFCRCDGEAPAHPRARFHRRNESHLIEAVVERGLRVARHQANLRDHRRDE